MEEKRKSSDFTISETEILLIKKEFEQQNWPSAPHEMASHTKCLEWLYVMNQQ